MVDLFHTNEAESTMYDSARNFEHLMRSFSSIDTHAALLECTPSLIELRAERHQLEKKMELLQASSKARFLQAKELSHIHINSLRRTIEYTEKQEAASQIRNNELLLQIDSVISNIHGVMKSSGNKLFSSKIEFKKNMDTLFPKFLKKNEMWRVEEGKRIEKRRKETENRRRKATLLFEKEQVSLKLLAQKKHELKTVEILECKEAANRATVLREVYKDIREVDELMARAARCEIKNDTVNVDSTPQNTLYDRIIGQRMTEDDEKLMRLDTQEIELEQRVKNIGMNLEEIETKPEKEVQRSTNNQTNTQTIESKQLSQPRKVKNVKGNLNLDNINNVSSKELQNQKKCSVVKVGQSGSSSEQSILGGLDSSFDESVDSPLVRHKIKNIGFNVPTPEISLRKGLQISNKITVCTPVRKKQSLAATHIGSRRWSLSDEDEVFMNDVNSHDENKNDSKIKDVKQGDGTNIERKSDDTDSEFEWNAMMNDSDEDIE